MHFDEIHNFLELVGSLTRYNSRISHDNVHWAVQTETDQAGLSEAEITPKKEERHYHSAEVSLSNFLQVLCCIRKGLS